MWYNVSRYVIPNGFQNLNFRLSQPQPNSVDTVSLFPPSSILLPPMSIFFPVAEFFEKSGNRSAEYPEKLRDGIAQHVCNIWSRAPGYFVEDGTLFFSFARGYLNSMCAPVQPPVPAPEIPFTGGQCDVVYNVSGVRGKNGIGHCDDLVVDIPWGLSVRGPIRGIGQIFIEDRAKFDCETGQQIGSMKWYSASLLHSGDNGEASTPIIFHDDAYDSSQVVIIQSVTRADGLADDCGDLGAGYPDVVVEPGDFDTTIEIDVGDGVPITHTVVYDQRSTTNNFPIGFQVNGNNVTVDVGGITITGNSVPQSPDSDTPPSPPGSQKRRDETSTIKTTTFEAPAPATFEDIPVTEFDDILVETVLCEEGVIEVVEEVLKLSPLDSDAIRLLFAVLKQIQEELCGAVDTEVGFPEVYPVLPGVERPCIVYYWKEVKNGKKQPSTYTTTVPNPADAAIANIENVKPPKRTLGTTVLSIRLADGSRVIASGAGRSAALVGFTFLLSQVNAEFFPLEIDKCTVQTEYPKLQEKKVECVQIEYYPFGKAQGVTAEVIRTIKLDL